YSASPGATKWISFKATCTGGSIAARARSETSYKFGASTSASPGIAWSSSNIYNPTFSSGARQTLWLKDPLVSHKDTVINLTDLYTQKKSDGTAITLNSSTEEAVLMSTSVTYGTVRYNKDTNAAQTISSATAGANSSYFTTVSWANAVTTSVYNGTAVTANQTRGYTQLKLRGKANVPAGPYYYVMTVTVQLQDKYSGTAQSSATFDIVYRVDNTRPYLKNPAPSLSVQSGSTGSIALSSICTDEDGNTLRIAEVKVPTKEFVSVDQYGNLRDTTKDAGANAYYNVGTKATNAATSAATGTDTGFATNWIYKVSASGADNSLPSGTGEGNADVSYAGYYVNSARNTLYITGNKATRSLYKTNRGKSNAGHFYILVRIVDSGDETDAGIWLPVGITVTTAAPTAANYPSVSGNAGDTFYFTPLSILQNGVYNGVGAVDKANATSFNGGSENVRPFAYDRDNMLVTASARTTTLTAANGITPPSALQATGTGVN
ncbi:MAG: hypothetical protein K2L51_04570, partial [Clostridiales bacterium]|nr:hypothetical protein [Clostridiales bacterium]